MISWADACIILTKVSLKFSQYFFRTVLLLDPTTLDQCEPMPDYELILVSTHSPHGPLFNAFLIEV